MVVFLTPGLCLKNSDQSSRISHSQDPIPTSISYTTEILLESGLLPQSSPCALVWVSSSLSRTCAVAAYLACLQHFPCHFIFAPPTRVILLDRLCLTSLPWWKTSIGFPDFSIKSKCLSLAHHISYALAILNLFLQPLQHLVSSEVWLPLPGKLFWPLSAL